MQGTWVQYLVGELGAHMLQGNWAHCHNKDQEQPKFQNNNNSDCMWQPWQWKIENTNPQLIYSTSKCLSQKDCICEQGRSKNVTAALYRSPRSCIINVPLSEGPFHSLKTTSVTPLFKGTAASLKATVQFSILPPTHMGQSYLPMHLHSLSAFPPQPPTCFCAQLCFETAVKGADISAWLQAANSSSFLKPWLPTSSYFSPSHKPHLFHLPCWLDSGTPFLLFPSPSPLRWHQPVLWLSKHLYVPKYTLPALTLT